MKQLLALDRDALTRRIPLGLLDEPEDVVTVVAYLAYGAKFVTGAELVVDGGATARE